MWWFNCKSHMWLLTYTLSHNTSRLPAAIAWYSRSCTRPLGPSPLFRTRPRICRYGPARHERGNRAYLASQARPMQRSAHMLWLKGNMHTKRSKRGQPNTGLEEPVCADAYNQSNVCCMQLAWWGRAWFVDAGRLGTPSHPITPFMEREVEKESNVEKEEEDTTPSVLNYKSF